MLATQPTSAGAACLHQPTPLTYSLTACATSPACATTPSTASSRACNTTTHADSLANDARAAAQSPSDFVTNNIDTPLGSATNNSNMISTPFIAATATPIATATATADDDDQVLQRMFSSRCAMTDVPPEAEAERRRRLSFMMRQSRHYKLLQVERANSVWDSQPAVDADCAPAAVHPSAFAAGLDLESSSPSPHTTHDSSIGEPAEARWTRPVESGLCNNADLQPVAAIHCNGDAARFEGRDRQAVDAQLNRTLPAPMQAPSPCAQEQTPTITMAAPSRRVSFARHIRFIDSDVSSASLASTSDVEHSAALPPAEVPVPAAIRSSTAHSPSQRGSDARRLSTSMALPARQSTSTLTSTATSHGDQFTESYWSASSSSSASSASTAVNTTSSSSSLSLSSSSVQTTSRPRRISSAWKQFVRALGSHLPHRAATRPAALPLSAIPIDSYQVYQSQYAQQSKAVAKAGIIQQRQQTQFEIML
ncbi:hypothetical protein BC831DRAFT_454723 [Entophlyctis helioformis]|nr:hypothetical protein BC831DRAFT_454723 [Entophlyctis helioformis]